MNRPTLTNIVGPAGRGAVLIIASLLMASAILRLGIGAGSALAQDGQSTTASVPTPQAVGETGKNSDRGLEKPPLSADGRKNMSGLIKALNDREARVIEREKQIEMRMRALAVADSEIEKRLQMLAETETNLRATISLADEAAEKDLARLTSVYENMKPKEAAALFEEMEPAFAAGFLGRMSAPTAAEVMAGLSPTVAYTVSVILAGRNANVPKN